MSKDIIRKFLSDAANHPDTAEVLIGDQKVTLGDLRALDSEQRSELSAKIEEVGKERQKVIDIAQKAQAAYSTAQEKLAAAERATAASPAAAAAGAADPMDSEVWYQPVAKRLKTELETRDKTIGELRDMLKTVVTVVTNAANTFSEDRWDSQYNRLDFGKREKKPTRDELLEYAKTNKLIDRHNLPSIELAWNKMSEGDRLEAAKKTEFERGREAGRMEHVASRIPAPGSTGPGAVLPQKVPVGGDVMGDLYAESMKDPELRALVEQLGTAQIM